MLYSKLLIIEQIIHLSTILFLKTLVKARNKKIINKLYYQTNRLMLALIILLDNTRKQLVIMFMHLVLFLPG